MCLKNRICTAVICLFSLTAKVAPADSFYAGVAAGGTFPAGGTTFNSAGNAYEGVLGFQPNKFVGIETGILYTDWKLYSDNNYKTVTGNATLTRATIAVLGYLPVWEYGALFGKFGLARSLYNLAACTNCPNDRISPTSDSMIRGVGVVFFRQETPQEQLRLGIENYSADSPLNPNLAVDHIYLMVTVGL